MFVAARRATKRGNGCIKLFSCAHERASHCAATAALFVCKSDDRAYTRLFSFLSFFIFFLFFIRMMVDRSIVAARERVDERCGG